MGDTRGRWVDYRESLPLRPTEGVAETRAATTEPERIDPEAFEPHREAQ